MIQNIETFWIFIAAGGEGEGEEVLNLIFLEVRFKLESGGGVLGLHSLTCFWLITCKHGRFFHQKSYVIPLKKKNFTPKHVVKKNLLFFFGFFFCFLLLFDCFFVDIPFLDSVSISYELKITWYLVINVYTCTLFDISLFYGNLKWCY